MKLKLITLAVLLFSATSAQAIIIYKFDFSNLTGVTGGTGADFSITLNYSNYVTTTGMTALPGTPLPTTLGYTVAYAGTNSSGWWGFDDDANSILTDTGFSFAGQSFLFQPTPPLGAYFTAPGIYAGRVSGNAPNSFSGLANLTITDTSAVSEPAMLSLLILGLTGIGLARRKQKA